MALSNWDTFAMSEKGEALAGEFTSPLGIVVEFYKNWFYIRDEQAWREGGGYSKSFVAKIDEGKLQYQDVHILALRGPQSGIYAVVWSGWGDDVKGMIGAGVSGYDNDGEWIGITDESLDWFQKKLQETVTREYVITSIDCDLVDGEPKTFESEETRTYESPAFDIPEVFRTMDLKKGGLRFNQGDAFFAAHLGGEIPATAPGKSETPLMSQMIKKMGE